MSASLGPPGDQRTRRFLEEGQPINLQLIGAAKGDLDVLELAAAYEAATLWVQRRPPPALTPR